jgi:DNA-directed RNA polymerase specialized sigma24 family protein
VSDPAGRASAKPGEETVESFELPEVADVLGISRDELAKHLRRARREIQTAR